MITTALELFWEFFKIGLFAVGGGPATLPFLMDLTNAKPWYTMEQLTNMIAISESTPGPLGLNMSTYAGFQTLGLFGGLVSSFGLVLPSVVIIILIARFLDNFSQNPYVRAAFYGIRPAVTAAQPRAARIAAKRKTARRYLKACLKAILAAKASPRATAKLIHHHRKAQRRKKLKSRQVMRYF